MVQHAIPAIATPETVQPKADAHLSSMGACCLSVRAPISSPPPPVVNLGHDLSPRVPTLLAPTLCAQISVRGKDAKSGIEAMSREEACRVRHRSPNITNYYNLYNNKE